MFDLLRFDGVDDYVSTRLRASSTSTIDISADFISTSTERQALPHGAGAGHLEINRYDAGGVSFIIAVGSSFVILRSTANAITINERATVRGIYDGSTISLYINDVVVDSVSRSGSLSSILDFAIGRHSTADLYHFSGDLISATITIDNIERQFLPSLSTGAGEQLFNNFDSVIGTLENFSNDDSHWVSYEDESETTFQFTGKSHAISTISGAIKKITQATANVGANTLTQGHFEKSAQALGSSSALANTVTEFKKFVAITGSNLVNISIGGDYTKVAELSGYSEAHAKSLGSIEKLTAFTGISEATATITGAFNAVFDDSDLPPIDTPADIFEFTGHSVAIASTSCVYEKAAVLLTSQIDATASTSGRSFKTSQHIGHIQLLAKTEGQPLKHVALTGQSNVFANTLGSFTNPDGIVILPSFRIDGELVSLRFDGATQTRRFDGELPPHLQLKDDRFFIRFDGDTA